MAIFFSQYMYNVNWYFIDKHSIYAIKKKKYHSVNINLKWRNIFLFYIFVRLYEFQKFRSLINLKIWEK